MFTDVVVPLDGSETARRAVAPAADLARRLDATLTLLTVVPDRGPALTREELDAMAAAVTSVRVEVEMRFGVPVAELIQAVGARPGRVLCMSTHGRTGFGRAILGSVAEGVMRGVDAPVVLVGPHVDPGARRAYDSLVVALDGSATGEALLPVVEQLAAALRMHVDLVQVVAPLAEAPTERERVSEGYTGPDSYLANVEQRLRVAGVDCARQVVPDERPAPAIVDFVRARGASLVAVATHGHGAALQLLMGSVASAVVRSSSTPVLVVRDRAGS